MQEINEADQNMFASVQVVLMSCKHEGEGTLDAKEQILQV